MFAWDGPSGHVIDADQRELPVHVRSHAHLSVAVLTLGGRTVNAAQPLIRAKVCTGMLQGNPLPLRRHQTCAPCSWRRPIVSHQKSSETENEAPLSLSPWRSKHCVVSAEAPARRLPVRVEGLVVEPFTIGSHCYQDRRNAMLALISRPTAKTSTLVAAMGVDRIRRSGMKPARVTIAVAEREPRRSRFLYALLRALSAWTA
jgi:hypothetical protein